ncbi:MAG TPA: magnesium chelatase domain-containing protein, partial [Amycolatopsis sp.]|nr:magnesium chelatase domain-containing protein [Amycolatopsis sp.]
MQTTHSMALSGADATPITVHAMIDTTPTPQPAVTGTVSRECVDRVRAAIRNSGFAWPGGNIDIATAGCTSAEDLAIAAAVLAAASTVSPARLGSTVLLAELGLDGTLRAVHGILARVLAARDAGYTHVVLAPAGYAEASLVDGITVHAMATVADVVTWLNQDATATSDARPPAVVDPVPTSDASPHSDGTGAVAAMLRDTEIRDALVVAAAGGHPILITTRSRSS